MSTNPQGGRPSYQPNERDRGLVEGMAACGETESNIALVIGISPKTLRKHFREELDTAHIKANAKVAQNLFRIATSNSKEAVGAARFWLKTRARWSESPVRDIMLRKKLCDAFELDDEPCLEAGERLVNG